VPHAMLFAHTSCSLLVAATDCFLRVTPAFSQATTTRR